MGSKRTHQQSRTPSESSQRQVADGGTNSRVPVKLQRQSSAEVWGQTLGFIGQDQDQDQDRPQYGNRNNVPEFSSHMLTSIRKYADGTLREPQAPVGMRPSLLAPTPTEFNYAATSATSSSSASSPPLTNFKGT